MKHPVTAGVVGLALAALLVGCTPSAGDGRPGAAPTTPVATEVAASPEPTPIRTPTTRPASIPTDCTDLVAPEVYAATMRDTPLNDPAFFGQPMGQVTPAAPAEDADPRGVVAAADQLRCGWRDIRADTTGLFVDVGTVDPATAEAYVAWLAEPREATTPSWLDGVAYACAPAHGGTQCQYATTHPMYGTEMADTVLVRDGVVVTVTQSNYPTDDLMGAVVTRLWG